MTLPLSLRLRENLLRNKARNKRNQKPRQSAVPNCSCTSFGKGTQSPGSRENTAGFPMYFSLKRSSLLGHQTNRLNMMSVSTWEL